MAGRVASAASGSGCRGATLGRLILDTTVIVAEERGRADLEQLIADDDDIAIAAITVAELLVGVELAGAGQRPRRQAFVESILTTIPVEDYDLEVARSHAVLLAHVRRSGRARGAHDLVIAATALARERTVVTADRSGFAGLPGLAMRQLPG
ncbi:MAG TPA: PIN domain-containing protein [Actinomycetota bacterium]|nr:PIN domain-containing protein [Actinomycetota bacterium]